MLKKSKDWFTQISWRLFAYFICPIFQFVWLLFQVLRWTVNISEEAFYIFRVFCFVDTSVINIFLITFWNNFKQPVLSLKPYIAHDVQYWETGNYLFYEYVKKPKMKNSFHSDFEPYLISRLGVINNVKYLRFIVEIFQKYGVFTKLSLNMRKGLLAWSDCIPKEPHDCIMHLKLIRVSFKSL